MIKSKLVVTSTIMAAAIAAFVIVNRGPFPDDTVQAAVSNEAGGQSAKRITTRDPFRHLAEPDAPMADVQPIGAGAPSAGVDNPVPPAATNSSATVAPATVAQGPVAGAAVRGAIEGITVATPLVTPVPSGGGGGIPASRG